MEESTHAFDLFQRGLSQFNEQHFFDAHETWEELWLASQGDDQRFYQGMIQLAVVLVHLQRGNPRGIRSVWKTAQTKFQGLPEVFRGIAWQELLAQMQAYLQPVFEMPASAFAPGVGQGQVMPIDWRLAPRILPQGPFEADSD
jgi:predicted metal-dependent hydrolase